MRAVYSTLFWHENEKFIETDGGIISLMWLKRSTFSKFLIPSTILIIIYNIINKKSVSLEIYVTRYNFNLHTFCYIFFIKINPLVPFVPSRIDNIVIILPFCFEF